MSIEAKEVYGKSESGSTQRNGERTVIRMFHVTHGGGSITSGNITLQEALDASYLPEIDDTISVPNDSGAGGFGAGSSVTLYYYGTRNFQRVDGHNDLWLLSYEYNTATTPSGSGQTTVATGSVDIVSKNVYRGNATLPSSVDDPSNTIDISGKKVDDASGAAQLWFPEASLNVKEFVRNKPNLVWFSSKVGTRNASFWNGVPAGAAMFAGIQYSENTDTAMWEVDYSFIVDLVTFHLLQVAQTNPNGSTFTTGDEDGGENATWQAAHVFWVQPFGTEDFSSFPT